jgi:hypothetical protein
MLDTGIPYQERKTGGPAIIPRDLVSAFTPPNPLHGKSATIPQDQTVPKTGLSTLPVYSTSGNTGMADIESLYKKEDGRILIEIKLSSVIQLFNSFDPAPFHEKELDSAAEHYIVDMVKDFPPKTRFKIIIYLPPDIATTERAMKIPPAIHNHFQYKMLVSERKFRSHFRHGRSTLLIGMTFLAIALIARQLVSALENHFIAQLFADALLIIGWAAMWEPITVLLYELWPIIQLKKTYEKISTMEIDILSST